MRGNMDTYGIPSYSNALKQFYSWWNIEIKSNIIENLIEILSIKEDESKTIEEIKNFREEFNIYPDYNITLRDIIRFRSLKIYSWLYGDFSNRLRMFFERRDIEIYKNIIENSVFVSIDSICIFEDIVSRRYNYNRYVKNMAESLSFRFESQYIGTHYLKRKFFACILIQRSWRNSISNPKYKLCRDRLLREFSEMNNSL
jgi:hypothetical protein